MCRVEGGGSGECEPRIEVVVKKAGIGSGEGGGGILIKN